MSTSFLWRHWKYKADRPLNTRSQYPDLAAMFLVFSAWESFWFGPIWGQVIKRSWDWYCFWLLQRMYNLVMVKVLSKVFTNLVVQRHYKLQQSKVGISSQTFQLDNIWVKIEIISGAEYLGCYRDSWWSRQLEKRLYSSKSNSPAKCGTHCREAGYTYFGLQENSFNPRY